ncbi:hypothetical protein [Neorhizobium sp. DT-125]|uniref:hypothetical protein n=1 Tax=Neorhizobium sp. DT-125 TaxID=3396163 RepID=UPI003F1D95A2
MKRLKHVDIDCEVHDAGPDRPEDCRLLGEHGIEAFFLDHIGKIHWTGKMEYEG